VLVVDIDPSGIRHDDNAFKLNNSNNSNRADNF